MGIVCAEENLTRTHRIVDELDKSRANRPSSVVVDLFEILFRLALALRIALTPVESVEIQENHTAQVGRDELEIRVPIEHTTIDDARKRQSAVGWPEYLLVQRIFVPVGLARRVSRMKKQRFAARRQGIPERLEFSLIEVLSRQVGGHHHPVHA